MKAKIAALIKWAQGTRPFRVITRFGRANGPLLANGLSYQAVFAAFAAIWVAFAIFGLWVGASTSLRDAVVDTIANAVPGLIDQGEGGAISIGQLLSAQILGWTGAIAAVGLIWTSVGWFGAARAAVRAMFGQLDVQQNAIILKLKDAGLALGFGIALVISAALSLFATSLLETVLTWLGVAPGNSFAEIASRVAGLAVGFGFDIVVLLALYSILSAERLPRRALLQGVIGGAVVLEVLKALGSLLLGGASSNPLLASFAVIIGLLIWFNLLCTVVVLAAAWIGEAAERHSARSKGEPGERDSTEPEGAPDVAGPG